MHDVATRASAAGPATTMSIDTAARPAGARERRRSTTAAVLAIVALLLAALCLLLVVLPGTVLYSGAAGLGSALAGIVAYVLVRHDAGRLARVGAGVGSAALLVGLVVPIVSISLGGVPLDALR